jgi:hypothetical protein
LTLQTSRLQFWEEILKGRIAKSYGKEKGKENEQNAKLYRSLHELA